MSPLAQVPRALRVAVAAFLISSSPALAQTVNIRSIGKNTANLHASGLASVPLGSPTVTFTAALPAPNAVGAVGPGDVLVIGGETLYIKSYDSSTQVTLQSNATVDHSTPTSSFTIKRAYNTLTAWESARNGNLTGGNLVEVGAAYKDAAFTETLTIDGGTTDASHYLILTVPPGQRHNGTAGTGVVLDGQVADRLGFEIKDDYAIVEWFEVTNHHGPTGFPSVRVNAATNVLVQNMLIHDFTSGNSEGVAMKSSAVNGVTVRNSIIYNGDAEGIEGSDADDTLVVENCTVYGMNGSPGIGVDQKSGTPTTVTNTISMGNVGSDFNVPVGNQSHNLSEDGTASCGTCLPSQTASAQFANIAGGDFHLKGTATAIDNGTDLSASFWGDIDAGRRPADLGWDIGADEFNAATAVDLRTFTATGYDGGIVLRWETASELNNLGFQLYRSLSESGPYERITARAIPGLGSSPVGARYSYRDEGRGNGLAYFYELEDIDSGGRTKRHGPVTATPMAGVSRSGDDSSDRAGDEGPSVITYGTPSASSLQILDRGPAGVTLQLATEGFTAEPQEDGSVRLSIPGFEALTEAGGPGVPVRRAWVEAVAGRKVELLSVSVYGVVAFSSLLPTDAERLEAVAYGDGTVRAGRRRSRETARRGSREADWYPAEAARVASVGFQEDVKKALVELAPLRWDGTSGQLLMARQLVVRLSFRERDPSESTTDGLRGRSRRARDADRTREVQARLATTRSGLYAVRFEDLFGRRGRGIAASSLRLSRQGEAVAFHLEPQPDRFGPGSTLYFVSAGASANPYGNEAVYELDDGGGGRLMEISDASPAGGAVSHDWFRIRREEDQYYQAGLLNAPDRWLWDLLFAPETKSFSFGVVGLAPADEPSSLNVWLQGASDDRATPDHHVRLYVNGTFVEESSWDGKEAKRLSAELSPGILHEGDNRLEIENVGDTDAAYSMVLLDRFEVLYPRILAAIDGRLEGTFHESGVAQISGLGAGALLLDTTDADPRWLSGAPIADGSLRARVGEGRQYLAVGREALLRPEVRAARMTGLRRESNGADYLLVGPSELLAVAGPLLELRRSQGLRVEAVSIEDIDSEFGFGESSPEALKDFLRFAYHEWQAPSPRYVTLLGDATYDFKDLLGTGVQNRVPPLMVRTSYLWTASDPSYAAVNGDDILPDFAIGRLPAETVAEARTMVQKIVDYEAGDASVTGAPIILVADNADEAGNFEADADELASTALSGRDVQKIYLSALGKNATRSAILGAFDDGASVISYLGHGGIQLWASENVLDIADASALTPQSQQPLLLTMNCLNGYFHFPYSNSLAEELLKTEGKGAIAAFSPSGLSVNGPAHLYLKALLEELFSGRHLRLGDAILSAQEDYTETGSFPELLSIYHLFGDPALTLR